jgi:hypothetical protein
MIVVFRRLCSERGREEERKRGREEERKRGREEERKRGREEERKRGREEERKSLCVLIFDFCLFVFILLVFSAVVCVK